MPDKTEDLWRKYAGDFNAFTDREVSDEVDEAQQRIDDDTEWLEAVKSWVDAGRPRAEDKS